ncbi:hypothetical protein PT974_10753 [Cladobotryum mycophilum]|uniref:Uncharacterized protein n=1 Tax=Cladobotryum mycophilum TaxID=491253 RepID=A0ABR0SAQ0_9HYPO
MDQDEPPQKKARSEGQSCGLVHQPSDKRKAGIPPWNPNDDLSKSQRAAYKDYVQQFVKTINDGLPEGYELSFSDKSFAPILKIQRPVELLPNEEVVAMIQELKGIQGHSHILTRKLVLILELYLDGNERAALRTVDEIVSGLRVIRHSIHSDWERLNNLRLEFSSPEELIANPDWNLWVPQAICRLFGIVVEDAPDWFSSIMWRVSHANKIPGLYSILSQISDSIHMLCHWNQLSLGSVEKRNGVFNEMAKRLDQAMHILAQREKRLSSLSLLDLWIRRLGKTEIVEMAEEDEVHSTWADLGQLKDYFYYGAWRLLSKGSLV